MPLERVSSTSCHDLDLSSRSFIAEIIDQWSGLANLLAELIEKYADKLYLDSLPSKVVFTET